MSKTKAILGVCLVFFLGIVTGIALSKRFVDQRVHQLAERGPTHLGEIVVRRLDHRLDLTAQQREAIFKIVTQSREQFDAIRKEMNPRLSKIHAESTTQIRALLTPEQLEKYDALVAEGRDPLRPPRGPRKGGPGGPDGPRGRRPHDGPPGPRHPRPNREGRPGEERANRKPLPPPSPAEAAPNGAHAVEEEALPPVPPSTPSQ